jgi:hypothetical protein
VFSQLRTLLNQPISDAELGIGPIKNVLLAQTTGSLTQREFVYQFRTIVNLTMLQVLALHALLDMI